MTDEELIAALLTAAGVRSDTEAGLMAKAADRIAALAHDRGALEPVTPAPDAAIREAANAVLSASYHDERDAEVAHAAILALLEKPHDRA